MTLIGLGFVVARFGLFLQLIDSAHPDTERIGSSAVVGVALSIGGGILAALAGVQFAAFVRELAPEDLPRSRLTFALSLLISFVVGSVGLLLGLFLLR